MNPGVNDIGLFTLKITYATDFDGITPSQKLNSHDLTIYRIQIGSGTIPNQIYQMGSPMSLSLPQIVTNPSGIMTNITWAASPLQSWISLSTSSLTIHSSDTALVGFTTKITIIATDVISGLTVSQFFDVLFKCTTSVNCSASGLSDVFYFISDVAILIIPACISLPSFCPNSTQLSLTSTGTSTPGGFAIVSKNLTNSFQIALYSSDHLINGQKYTFNLSFSDSYITSVIQPTMPSFEVEVKCTKTFCCQAAGKNQVTFIKQRIPNIEIMRQSIEYTTLQILKFEEFVYQPNFECGKVAKALYFSNTIVQAPMWIIVQNNQIQIDFQKQRSVFNQSIDLVVYLEEFSDQKITNTFNVALSDCEITCFTQSLKYYILGEGPKNFGVQYANKTSTNNLKLTIIQQPIAFIAQKQIEIPSFIKLDKTSFGFTINNATFEQTGSYRIGWKLGYAEFPQAQVQCTVPLQIKYDPKFIGETIDVQTLACKFPWSFKIPIFKDIFQEPVSSAVDLGATSNFLIYNQNSQNISVFNPSLLEIYKGNHTIFLDLTDQFGQKQKIEIKLVVICLDPDNKVSYRSNHIVYQLQPPRPYIKMIDNMGNLRVTFTRNIQLPTFKRFPEFLQEEFMQRNTTSGFTGHQERQLNAILHNSSQSDLDQALEIINRGLLRVNNTNLPVVNLQMVAGFEQNQSALEFTWKCIDFKPKYMDFVLNFTQISKVSQAEAKDSLKLNFYGKNYFTADDGQIFEDLSTEIVFFVPRQVNPSYAKKIQFISNSLTWTAKEVLTFNFFLTLVVIGTLQELFSRIKMMSIMVHLLIINVNIPTNAQLFFQILINFVNFNLIDIEEPLRKFLKLLDEQKINENLNQFGYHSNYSVINFGNLFVLMAVYLFLFLILGVTKKCKNERIRKFRNCLAQKLIWDYSLSFIQESYLVLAISCFINFTYYEFKHPGEIFSGIFAQFGAIILVFYPIFLLWFMLTSKEKVKDQEFRKKYEPIFQILSIKDDRSTLFEPFISVMRVLILTAVLIFLKKFRYFQIFCSNFLSVFRIIFIGWFEPYRQNVNFWQQYNEIFVILMIYHLICFADLIQDEPTRDIVGLSMIAFFSFNLTTNISHIMFGLIKPIFFIYRLKYQKWKREKLKKRIKQKQEKAEVKRLFEEEQKAQKNQILNQQEQLNLIQQQLEVGSLQSKFVIDEIGSILYRPMIQAKKKSKMRKRVTGKKKNKKVLKMKKQSKSPANKKSVISRQQEYPSIKSPVDSIQISESVYRSLSLESVQSSQISKSLGSSQISKSKYSPQIQVFAILSKDQESIESSQLSNLVLFQNNSGSMQSFGNSRSVQSSKNQSSDKSKSYCDDKLSIISEELQSIEEWKVKEPTQFKNKVQHQMNVQCQKILIPPKPISESDLLCLQRNVQNQAQNRFQRSEKSSTMINQKAKFQTPPITHFVKKKTERSLATKTNSSQVQKSKPLDNLFTAEIKDPRSNGLVTTKLKKSFKTQTKVQQLDIITQKSFIRQAKNKSNEQKSTPEHTIYRKQQAMVLSDPFEPAHHQMRVRQRQKEAVEQFNSVEQTQLMFAGLWLNDQFSCISFGAQPEERKQL